MSDEEYLNFLELQAPEIVEALRRFLSTCDFSCDYILEYRIKSLEKINLKKQFLEKKYSETVGIRDLNDIIGIRISVEDEDALPYIVGPLLRQ